MNDLADKLSAFSIALCDIDYGATISIADNTLSISVLTIDIDLGLANTKIIVESIDVGSIEDFDTLFTVMKTIKRYLED